MRFSAVAATLFTGYFFITLVLYFKWGDGSLVNDQSMLYLALLTLGLVTFVLCSSRETAALFFVLELFVFQRYCLPVLMLLIDHAYIRDWRSDYYNSYTAHDLESALLYGVLGSLAVFSGLFISTLKLRPAGGEGVSRAVQNARPMRALPINRLCMFYVVTLFVQGYQFLIAGAGHLLVRSSMSTLNFLNVFLNTEPLYWLLLSALFLARPQLEKREKYYIFSALTLNLLMSIVGGNRGFVFILMFNVIFLLCVRNGNFRVRLLSCVMVVAGGCLAVAVFPIATALRYAGREVTITADNFGRQMDYWYLSEGNAAVGMPFDAIHRISDIAPSMDIMSNKWMANPSRYINPGVIISDIVNLLTPRFIKGSTFDNLVMGPRVYAYVYQGYDEQWYYNTEQFGLYSYLYILFGYLGGIAALFVIGIAVGWLWMRFLRATRRYTGFWYLLLGNQFYLLLLQHGLSLWVSSIAKEVIVYVFDLVIVVVFFPALINALKYLAGSAGRRVARATAALK